ncbi:hypothetical protein NM688_g8169 [Phlebia brevispora]|uniref:Uncharacterized protein n=1 Tax=Phlebia brevispora TaxID=194682 RepID=A0ACC1RWL5_9APHY|nr:hypothetical protein NM688_g8169 [Phlebia brevispora]
MPGWLNTTENLVGLASNASTTTALVTTAYVAEKSTRPSACLRYGMDQLLTVVKILEKDKKVLPQLEFRQLTAEHNTLQRLGRIKERWNLRKDASQWASDATELCFKTKRASATHRALAMIQDSEDGGSLSYDSSSSECASTAEENEETVRERTEAALTSAEPRIPIPARIRARSLSHMDYIDINMMELAQPYARAEREQTEM